MLSKVALQLQTRTDAQRMAHIYSIITALYPADEQNKPSTYILAALNPFLPNTIHIY